MTELEQLVFQQLRAQLLEDTARIQVERAPTEHRALLRILHARRDRSQSIETGWRGPTDLAFVEDLAGDLHHEPLINDRYLDDRTWPDVEQFPERLVDDECEAVAR